MEDANEGNKMKKKTKEVLFMIVWFSTYIAAMQFLRFKFGIFQISAVWVLVGSALFWLFQKLIKPNSN
jgi:hypothetical protein